MTKIISTDAVINGIRLAEQSGSPVTPASGYYQLYTKNDGKLYGENDAGAESCLQLSSGSGITVSGGNINLATGMEQRIVLYDNILSGSGSWDVASIPQTYDHLEVLFHGRCDRAAEENNIYMYYNNDTTDTNYRTGGLLSGNTIAATYGDVPLVGNVSGTTATEETSLTKVFIPNYTKTNLGYKICTYDGSVYQADNAVYLRTGSMYWKSTSAINRIAVSTPSYNFVTNSRLQIIGIKTI